MISATPLASLARLGAHLLLAVLALTFVMPFAWQVTTSLQGDRERARVDPGLVPAPQGVADALERATGHHLAYQPTLDNYARGTTRVPVPLFLRNTVLVCLFTVVGAVLSSSLVAYGFAILRWRGRDALFFTMLATMMVPAQVTMVPVFRVWRDLGLVNTYAPLIVPAFFGVPFFTFLFRQFFLTVPRELIEAARMDGAGELRIWATIVMPLSRPVVATVALFAFLGAWNDFLNPLIYLADQDKYTLSLGLAMFRTQYESEYGQLMAVATLMVLPVIALFLLAQKTFIEGVKTTGLK
jgi:multiple sugar transport system permease protein